MSIVVKERKKPIVRYSHHDFLNTAVAKLLDVLGQESIDSAYVYDKNAFVDVHFKPGNFLIGGKTIEQIRRLGFEIRMITDLQRESILETVVGFALRK